MIKKSIKKNIGDNTNTSDSDSDNNIKKSKKSMKKFIQSESDNKDEIKIEKSKKSKKSMKKIIESENKDDNKKISKQIIKKCKMIDLCAGTGAFSYVFKLTNYVDVVYSNDFDESSKEIYDLNFDHELTLGNICDVNIKDIPKHDILIAGFPCQPFSIAGKQLGFDDDRSNVFWKILKIIKHHKPECIILENVKNLLTHDNKNTIKTIIESLEKEKYFIKYKILNTCEITDIPQNRERIYIVCLKDEYIYNNFNFDFPKIKNKKIKEMLQTNVDKKYYYKDEDNKIHKMIIDSVKNENTVYQFRRIYVRENKNNVCPTLTANMGMGGHNIPIILDDKLPRKLTPRECFNFQGFPDDYKLPNISNSKLYKLAGNSVSIPVVKLISEKLVPLLFDKINKIN
jgi:DNA (cytosine-5)-methyltransferase 1